LFVGEPGETLGDVDVEVCDEEVGTFECWDVAVEI
jgi:hypothetical protein